MLSNWTSRLTNCKTIPTFWDFLYIWTEKQNNKHLLLQLKKERFTNYWSKNELLSGSKKEEEGCLTFGQFLGTWQSLVIFHPDNHYRLIPDWKEPQGSSSSIFAGKSIVWMRWPITLSSWILSVQCWGIHHFPHNGEIIPMADYSHFPLVFSWNLPKCNLYTSFLTFP